MPKKERTEAEKKAWGEKMRAAKAAKAAKLATEPTEQSQPSEIATKQDDGNDIEQLRKQVLELQQMLLKQQMNPTPPSQETPQLNAQGKMTGTFEKYKLGADNYPDPKERLASEKRLAPFAFDYNYELNFEVGQSSYTTIDGIRTTEPKFTLQLIRKMLDDDGNDTMKRYGITQLIFHEDPDTALSIAREVGIDAEQMDEQTFLNEMRYLRMRDWLFSCFFPEPEAPKKNKKEMVIGNRLVEVWEVTSEDREAVDFSQLKHKL